MRFYLFYFRKNLAIRREFWGNNSARSGFVIANVIANFNWRWYLPAVAQAGLPVRDRAQAGKISDYNPLHCGGRIVNPAPAVKLSFDTPKMSQGVKEYKAKAMSFVKLFCYFFSCLYSPKMSKWSEVRKNCCNLLNFSLWTNFAEIIPIPIGEANNIIKLTNANQIGCFSYIWYLNINTIAQV